MKTIWCIAYKDFRRFGSALGFWIVLLVTLRVGAHYLFNTEPFHEATGGTIDAIGITLMLLHYLVCVFFVGALVRDDVVVGSHSFWVTRPIHGVHLLTEKLLVILCAVVIPPIAIDAVWMATQGFGVTEVFRSSVESAGVMGVIVLGTVSVVVWTGRRDGVSFLWAVAAIVCVPIIGTLMLVAGKAFLFSQRMMSVYWAISVQLLWLVGILTAIVLYITRSGRKALLALGLGVALVCAILVTWRPLGVGAVVSRILPIGVFPVIKTTWTPSGEQWEAVLNKPDTWRRVGSALRVEGTRFDDDGNVYVEIAIVLPEHRSGRYSWNLQLWDAKEGEAHRLSNKKLLCSAGIGGVRMQRYLLLVPNLVVEKAPVGSVDEQERWRSRFRVQIEQLEIKEISRSLSW